MDRRQGYVKRVGHKLSVEDPTRDVALGEYRGLFFYTPQLVFALCAAALPRRFVPRAERGTVLVAGAVCLSAATRRARARAGARPAGGR